MRRPSRPGLSLVLALYVGIPLAAQHLESIGTEKPFSFDGGVSFNQVFYSGRGASSHRDPYHFIASAHLNLSLYGLMIPLAFTASNHNAAFVQPFNQYALHPSWKWIAAHAGYTSMSFSPYTVNGHNFLGGGIELTPGTKWRFSALYGRFLKAVAYDTAALTSATPAFKRMGYGFQTSYGTGNDFVELIFFHAADEPGAILTMPDTAGIAPEENAVMSVRAGKTIFKHFRLKAEVATSALTRDTRAATTKHDHVLAHTGSLFTPRVSSTYDKAFKATFDYQQQGWLLGLAYERVDPGYRTLGAYYFNNDLEHVVVNGSAGMLQGRLNVAMSVGVQRDNLEKQKLSTMRRVTSSINVNYLSGDKLNLTASYSGFQSYANIHSRFDAINQLTPYDNPDTLNYTQISRNASLSGMLTLRKTDDTRQQLGLQLSWQDAAQQHGDDGDVGAARFYNLSCTYAARFVPRSTTLGIALNAVINDGSFIKTRTLGPTVSLTRSFFQRRFRNTLSSSYNCTYSNGTRVNTIINCRWSGSLSMNNKHKIKISAVMVRRRHSGEMVPQSVTEFTGTIGYNYTWSMR